MFWQLLLGLASWLRKPDESLSQLSSLQTLKFHIMDSTVQIKTQVVQNLHNCTLFACVITREIFLHIDRILLCLSVGVLWGRPELLGTRSYRCLKDTESLPHAFWPLFILKKSTAEDFNRKISRRLIRNGTVQTPVKLFNKVASPYKQTPSKLFWTSRVVVNYSSSREQLWDFMFSPLRLLVRFRAIRKHITQRS